MIHHARGQMILVFYHHNYHSKHRHHHHHHLLLLLHHLRQYWPTISPISLNNTSHHQIFIDDILLSPGNFPWPFFLLLLLLFPLLLLLLLLLLFSLFFVLLVLVLFFLLIVPVSPSFHSYFLCSRILCSPFFAFFCHFLLPCFTPSPPSLLLCFLFLLFMIMKVFLI